MTYLERVAKAIGNHIHIISGSADRDAAAKAAIEAMREPTAAMLHAATMQPPTWDDDASRRKWQAMIDAALQRS